MRELHASDWENGIAKVRGSIPRSSIFAEQLC